MRRLTAPFVERLVEVELVDRAVALASQAFVALIPLLLVSSAIMPRGDGRSLADGLVRRFELDGEAAAAVDRIFAPPADVRGALSFGGVLLLMVSALSFCRALQRLYERTWRLAPRGLRGTPNQLSWIALVVVYFSVVGTVTTTATDRLGPVGQIAVGLGCGFFLWLWTPYLLLGRRVERAALRGTALLTATAVTVASLASVVYMPQAIVSSAAQFGLIGIAISIVSWLIGLAFVIVGAAALGAVLAERSARAPAARAAAGASTRTAGTRT